MSGLRTRIKGFGGGDGPWEGEQKAPEVGREGPRWGGKRPGPGIRQKDSDPVGPIGPARRSARHTAGTGTAGSGPTYRAAGRMIFESAACSRMLALQPTTLPAAKVGVNISRGRPHSSMTTPA